MNVHHRVAHKALGILMMCLPISCGESYDQGQAKEKVIQEEESSRAAAKRTQDIQELAQRYNATTTWSDDLQKGTLTTAILKTTLMQTNDRLLIVRGLLIDVVPRNTSHIITFRTSDIPYSFVNGQHLIFEVECALSQTQVSSLRPSPYRSLFRPPDLLVVTNVTDVTASHSLMSEANGESSATVVQSVFKATGKCVLVRPESIG